MCGDSTRDEDVDRLLDGRSVAAVIEDPPYAIYGSSTGIASDVADDKMVRPFFTAIMRQARRILIPFGHVYVHTDWRSWSSLWEGAKLAGLTPKNCIVWDKGDGGIGSMWSQCHEMIGFFANTPPQLSTRSGRKSGERMVHGRSNIQRFSRVRGSERLHNSAKPLGLLREMINASTEPGDLIFDGFGGSGSVLVACEAEGRGCRAVEIDPRWCDVIVRRWEDFTGLKAERVESEVKLRSHRRRRRR
jgi:DNA modification methylase